MHDSKIFCFYRWFIISGIILLMGFFAFSSAASQTHMAARSFSSQHVVATIGGNVLMCGKQC